MTPSDDREHRYESMFHLDAEAASVDEETRSVTTENHDTSNLAIIPPRGDNVSVEIISGQEDPIVQGWIPAGGYKVRPIPTPIFTRTGKGATWFVYVFYPIPRGQSSPITSVEPVKVELDNRTYPNARAVLISFDDGTKHYFMQAEQGGEILEFGGFSTDAEAALIQVGQDGGVESRSEVRE
jgi:hypothetical protein